MSDVSQRIKQSTLRKEADEIFKALPGCFQIYFRNMRTENMSERTIKQYAYDTDGFLNYIKEFPQFKNKDLYELSIKEILDNLSRNDIQDYIDSISTYELNGENRVSSPSYISRKISSLKSLYNFFQSNNLIETNPASLVKNPKLKSKNILIMEKDEINRIIEAVESYEGLSETEKKKHNQHIKRDLAIMMLFLGTGIRVSELCGIDLSDIDFNEASLKVVRKGGDEDEVFFSDIVQNALIDYIENERINYASKEENALFISAHKKRITERSVELLIKKYSLKAGLNKKITPHALRRTFGTNLYEATGDIYLTANALHHKSVDTTRQHYVRKNREITRDAVTHLNIFDNKD